MHKRGLVVLITVLALTALAFSSVGSTGVSSSPELKAASTQQCIQIQSGLNFLNSQFNADTGLLRESPVIAPNKFWLNNDNSLAVFTLNKLGSSTLALSLQRSLTKYGYPTNNFIEVVFGKVVSWPPSTARNVIVTTVGANEILQEFHDTSSVFSDWKDYSNLAFMGSLNEFNKGNRTNAVSIFRDAMKAFDGNGFKDKAFSGNYAAYKVALALYTGVKISAPLGSNGVKMRNILLKRQNVSGGFVTDYSTSQQYIGDPNTETTALSILALNAYGCGNTATGVGSSR